MSKNALRETIGFVGIALSLVFVGYELRQNTQAERAAAYQELGAGLADYWGALVDNPEAAELNLRFFEEDGAEFTPREEAILISAAVSNFRLLEVTWRQVNLGLVEPEALETMGYNAEASAAFTGNMRGLWPRIGHFMSPDFKAVLEDQFGIAGP